MQSIWSNNTFPWTKYEPNWAYPAKGLFMGGWIHVVRDWLSLGLLFYTGEFWRSLGICIQTLCQIGTDTVLLVLLKTQISVFCFGPSTHFSIQFCCAILGQFNLHFQQWWAGSYKNRWGCENAWSFSHNDVCKARQNVGFTSHQTILIQQFKR